MTDPESAEAVRASDRAHGLVAASDETMAWVGAARARQRAYEADEAAFTAQVKRNMDAIAALISARMELPEGYRFEWK